MYLRTCKSAAQSDDGMTCMGGDANVLHGSEWCISLWLDSVIL